MLLADRVLSVQVEFADTSVIITEPYFNFTSIQESMNEILFEEYQFQSALRTNGESVLRLHSDKSREQMSSKDSKVILL